MILGLWGHFPTSNPHGTKFWCHFGSLWDFILTSKTSLDHDWNRRSKNDKSEPPQGGSGGARPLIGGNPPSGPAGAGRVGVIARGGIVDPFWNEKIFLWCFPIWWIHGWIHWMDPCIDPCMDSSMDALIIFSFQKGSTIPPRAITPTRPAPAGPDGGVRGA